MPKYLDDLPFEEQISVSYSFTSQLGPIENNRWVQRITGEIRVEDETGKEVKIIGHIYAYKLLLVLARQNGWDEFSIFDTDYELMRIGELIYDFDKRDFKRSLHQYFKGEILEDDLLYIDTIEILPQYLGYQIGEHAIKDMTNNFEAGCSIIAVDCIPLQNTNWINQEDSKAFNAQMKYELFESDEVKAKQRLIQYLKRVGFYYIPEISEDHMFLNTHLRNPNFDYIELE